MLRLHIYNLVFIFSMTAFDAYFFLDMCMTEHGKKRAFCVPSYSPKKKKEKEKTKSVLFTVPLLLLLFVFLFVCMHDESLWYFKEVAKVDLLCIVSSLFPLLFIITVTISVLLFFFLIILVFIVFKDALLSMSSSERQFVSSF